MTFATAPWALDGARIGSALARTASYAETSGSEGVISPTDLKVTPLAVPGVGVRIAAGGALLLNRYQTTPSQTYTVLNDDVTVVDSSLMPPASGSQKVYLLCITIGDPAFSQVGHPWMTSSDPAAGTEETFQYVRPWMLQVNDTSVKTAKAAGVTYPALALAQIVIPANTTTITSSMITDVRKVARPRSSEEIFTVDGASNNLLNGAGGVAGTWENWPNTAHFSVDVPDWAVTAKIMGYVEGTILTKAGSGGLRVAFANGGATTNTSLNESGSSGRRSYNVGGKIDVRGYQGTTQTIRMEGTPNNDASKGFLDTDTLTSALIRVRFEEAAI